MKWGSAAPLERSVWPGIMVAALLVLAGCAPPCEPGSPDCHHTLTGWRYQPPTSFRLINNCPGELACGDGSIPVYEPTYSIVPAPELPARGDSPPLHLDLDPSGRFGGVPVQSCPGIMLPGTNTCLLPGPNRFGH
jgi:hypothetical protein